MGNYLHEGARKTYFVATHAGFYRKWLCRYLPLMLRYWRSRWRAQGDDSSGPTVYLDLKTRTQRSFFNLAFSLHEASCRLYLKHDPLQLANLKSWDRHIVELPTLQLTRKSPAAIEPDVVLADHDLGAFCSNTARIDLDYFSPLAKDEYRLPIGIHPMHRWSGSYERNKALAANEKRPITMFFAGNIGSPKYARDTVQSGFGKLNRRDCIDTVVEYLGERCVFPEMLDENYGYPAPVVLCDSTRQWVRGHQVFKHLAYARFALCPSGVDYPHCHNYVEAMLMGAIPVIEYDELLDPPLEHEVNCLAYRGKSGLKEVLDLALAMPESEVRRIREGVLDYADSHLHGKGIVKKLCGNNAINKMKLLDHVGSLRAHFQRLGIAEKLPW